MFSVMIAGAAMAAASPQSAQAAFDAATKAAEAGQCEEAIAAFDRLAAGPAGRNKTVAAAIAVRRGQCLRRLGRHEEAERSIRAGVAAIEAQGGSFRAEARDAYVALAQIGTTNLTYDQAIADVNKALALSEGTERVVPLQIRSRLTRFDGDGAAIRDAEEALKLLPAATPKPDLASAQIFAGRALLAAGRVAEADALLKKALANNGGLTLRVSLADIATRYDLAQVALLKKNMDDARKYLVYTGAGRISEAPFASARSIEAPTCDSAPGLTPDSYAVVEFALDDNGAVQSAQPIFVQGGREVALAYARAVREWSWAPEDAAKIPVFYRALTRVELRCSKAGETMDLQAPLIQESEAWLAGKGATGTPTEQQAAGLATLRQAAGGSDAAALRANLVLAGSGLIGTPERTAASDRAVALAATLAAPQAVRTHAALMQIEASGWPDRREQGVRLRKLDALLADRAVAADPVSRATVQLRVAEIRQRLAGNRAADPALDAALTAVADTPDLPERHPLRARALLGLANNAAARGDFEAAQRAFARTGLDEQQCSLVGAKPDMKRSGASSAFYPTELTRLGFEGWSRIEFDIAADGKTVGPRTIMSYPPFLFGDAAKEMIARARFEQSYRPANGLACAADQRTFVFRLPT
ncbi:hypothetical protein COC42_01210 [Sphingomonas spermidinifaciens]|uniref:TonB C-terminal domain-containing protein n=1 Tax=Sphingomonas spermidinifaciens TaxID=1141889 RepID=A0A2A4B550_9SPHN|nr:energy transducer TonB [Sphingomonas spermidinifaciens]PCD03072.1 hypothetical protein COC42_01210 [Sphingomonas spermidinifaciens]